MINKNIKSKFIKVWCDGYTLGEKSVLEFLKQMKNLDVEKEYNLWTNADFIKDIQRCEK